MNSGLAPQSVVLCAAFLILGMPQAGVQNAGLPPEWELQDSLNSLVNATQKLLPLVQEAKPEDWTAKGAPDAYQAQWKSVVDEIGFLQRSAVELGAEPERLTLALETYFRAQSLHALVLSFNEGVRRYQNPALADSISGAVTGTSAGREKLREYIVKLAGAKEQQLKVMDQEAQRCRALLAKQPAAKKNPEKKAEPK
jgi:hypothetical protein